MRNTDGGVLRAAPGETPNAGTGLFATTRILIGQPILELDTWLAVLDTARLADTCSNCFGGKTLRDREVDGAPQVPLKLCTGCRTVRYCSKGCQKENWAAIHKHECKIFKNLYPNVLPTPSRAVLRILLLKKHQEDQGDRLQRFDSLTSHLTETIRTKPDHFQNLVLCARAIHEYSKTELSLQEVVDCFGKLDINAFTLTTPFYDQIGAAVEPLASLCNHSCDPNAAVDFDKGKTWLRALQHIEEGEQIFVSYVEPTDACLHRQAELSKRYYFECECPRCIREKEIGDGEFLKEVTDLDSKLVDDAQKEAVGLLEAAKSRISPAASIRSLKRAMSILRKTLVWPLTRQPYVRLRNELIASLMDAQQLQCVFVQCAIRHLRIDPVVYPAKWHPVATMHKWMFVSLMRYLTQAGNLGFAEGIDLSKYQLNLFLLIYSILLDLEVTASNELPTVEDIYRGSLSLFVDAEWTLEAMQPDIDKEWEKVEKLVDDALRIDEASV
ncbi:hypothetical protein D8B26_001100 [Coccidioides posadasii str. Silveira]|uniref:Uncharacterized protein n=3 Tax=Coccidioides posadasii TaxID=199306 RepID=E9CTT8_COCPS|nr:MYND finger family protein [Coccidioides posadasii C735 delta SOWgp]EER28629.1 MYND finger family protein [Coccidioides posadasii C735 delta SOWgp]EFW22181.1 conserved hypothetical protein [Coccidioides posadasii str. Silveira]KMM64279.1 hypothetical protein CPAG_00631 [Coccidioides posadasii RMSCC 3488]QVM06387.1 hypothetical protein D8B26_001100 [Coccidioides posadasii str. Silveira]|eukprot:XP_003070774.1 MYND finger family protein [Coccidioides posadasii C735 delta SOWgp]